MPLGGGCELTYVCDIVVADETAPLRHAGGVGRARAGARRRPWLGAREPALDEVHDLHGRGSRCREARFAGIVNRVTPAGEHLALADDLARKIAERAPLALTVGKEILGRQAPQAFEHAVDGVAYLQGTEDFAEGIEAFKERREPRFEGR